MTTFGNALAYIYERLKLGYFLMHQRLVLWFLSRNIAPTNI